MKCVGLLLRLYLNYMPYSEKIVDWPAGKTFSIKRVKLYHQIVIPASVTMASPV